MNLITISRPIIHVPENHRPDEVQPGKGPYCSMDWRDWIALIEHPASLVKSLIELILQTDTGLLWWKNPAEPIRITANGIEIDPLIAIDHAEPLVQIEPIQIPFESLPINTAGKTQTGGIYIRGVYVAEDRLVKLRDDRVLPPVDHVESKTTIERLQVESQCVIPDRPISGWLKIGSYEQQSGQNPHTAAGELPIIATMGGHREALEFDHPEQSVRSDHLEIGIYENAGLSAAAERISQKNLSDEIIEARGILSDLHNRINRVIDEEAGVQAKPIHVLCLREFERKYWKYDSEGRKIPDSALSKPNPFVYNSETGQYELNMEAVKDSGAGVLIGTVSTGTSPLHSTAEERDIDTTDPEDGATGSDVVLPTGFAAGSVFLIASPRHIQWGNATQPFDVTKIAGCNFEIRVERKDGTYHITSWSHMGFDDGTQYIHECSLEYLPIGLKPYGFDDSGQEEESDEEPYTPEYGDWDEYEDPDDDEPTPGDTSGIRHGRATVRVFNIPEMTDQNKDSINKQILFSLQSDGGYYVGIYHRYLQPDWPRGDWWPTWRIECGRNGHQASEWSIFESHDLGDEATFEIEWDHGRISVTANGNTQTINNSEAMVLSEICDSSASSRFGNESDAEIEIVSPIEDLD